MVGLNPGAPGFHHARPEKLFDKPEDVPIGDFRRQCPHDDRVWDVVEEPGDVSIEYLAVPLPSEFQHPLDRHVAIAAGPEAVGVLVKPPLEDGRQELPKHLLSHPIADGRDAERPQFRAVVAFGDKYATQRHGLKSPTLQVTHQRGEVLIEVDLEHLNAHFVDPRGPAIAFDVLERPTHHGFGDPAGQRMGLHLGRLSHHRLISSDSWTGRPRRVIHRDVS